MRARRFARAGSDVDVVLGEVDAGFEEGDEGNEFILDGSDGGRARRRAGARRAGLLEGGGVDEVVDGLGLGEVDAAGEEGALGELAGLGEARAGGAALAQESVRARRASRGRRSRRRLRRCRCGARRRRSPRLRPVHRRSQRPQSRRNAPAPPPARAATEAAASPPLSRPARSSRTTPMPPRPAGVEIATIVSGSKVTPTIMLADVLQITREQRAVRPELKTDRETGPGARASQQKK